MATVVSQHVRYLGGHLGLYKKFYFSKIVASVFEISKKHVLTDSNRNVIKNRVEKKKVEQNFVEKLHFSYSNFKLQN